VNGDSVVLYGVGSPVVADVEVSLARAGCRLAAGIRNVPGDVWLEDRGALVEASAIPPELLGLPFLVPLFTPGHRQHAMREACRAGLSRPYTLVDPTSAVPPGWTPGAGGFVNSGCAIGAAARFAEFVFVNRGASIGHHVLVGPFASIGPGVVIAGQVTIGKGAFLGAGAVVLPTISIGANAVVGAGAVVTRDVPDHAMAVGNPAKVVKTGIAGYHDVPVA
jgi:sugar O-acyltransferase (sialic acid O-acetyltransferase NeuD family)